MAPKHHPTPLSGGDRKALNKELGRARAMTTVLARHSQELRAEAEILIKQAGKLLWESWNERMWADGEPIDPSPTIDQALNGGYPWLQIACSRCKATRDVELASLSHASTTFVHDLASRLRCQKCAKAGRRPSATLEQLAPRTRHFPKTEDVPSGIDRMVLNIDAEFQGIWRRALNEPSLAALSSEMIENWARERRLDVTRVEERAVGAFGKTPAVVLTIGDRKGCFPKIPVDSEPAWTARRAEAEDEAALWNKMEWCLPLWVSKRDVAKILATARHSSREQALQWFHYHTSTLYTLPFQAMCIAQFLPQARCLSELVPLAREAYLAFYSGYRASSIAALIPAIEGSLSRIVSSSEQDLPIPIKIDRVIDRAIATAARLHFEQMWVPQEYLSKDYLFGQDERVFAFETFRRFLLNSFFRKTGEYEGVTWLNRHMFAHGTHSLWQQPANFERLVVILATLALIESWHDDTHRVSLIPPPMNEDSKLLWQEALARGFGQMGRQRREQRRYQKHGRLVPVMPTKDGSLLRRALLSDDCINELVRPLRDAGWSVDVGEADEQALYMTVVATSGEERITVGLLYSCATDNAIYRKLAETCSAILYRGAPYHQQQYAYGINVHVGPVAGWLPPVPRGGKRHWRSYPICRRFSRLKGRFAFAIKVIKHRIR